MAEDHESREKGHYSAERSSVRLRVEQPSLVTSESPMDSSVTAETAVQNPALEQSSLPEMLPEPEPSLDQEQNHGPQAIGNQPSRLTDGALTRELINDSTARWLGLGLHQALGRSIGVHALVVVLCGVVGLWVSQTTKPVQPFCNGISFELANSNSPTAVALTKNQHPESLAIKPNSKSPAVQPVLHAANTNDPVPDQTNARVSSSARTPSDNIIRQRVELSHGTTTEVKLSILPVPDTHSPQPTRKNEAVPTAGATAGSATSFKSSSKQAAAAAASGGIGRPYFYGRPVQADYYNDDCHGQCGWGPDERTGHFVATNLIKGPNFNQHSHTAFLQFYESLFFTQAAFIARRQHNEPAYVRYHELALKAAQRAKSELQFRISEGFNGSPSENVYKMNALKASLVTCKALSGEPDAIEAYMALPADQRSEHRAWHRYHLATIFRANGQLDIARKLLASTLPDEKDSYNMPVNWASSDDEIEQKIYCYEMISEIDRTQNNTVSANEAHAKAQALLQQIAKHNGAHHPGTIADEVKNEMEELRLIPCPADEKRI